MTVKIVTDSVCDLPVQVVSELGVTVVPLNVMFGTETYRDGIDLSSEEFYRRLKENKSLPTTSVPSPQVFAEAYDKVAEDTDEIIVMVIPANFSGTYNAAVQGTKIMKRKCRIEVIDTGWAVMAQGLIVITAARAAQSGASLDQILAVIRRNMKRVDMRATFDTLEYLRRGGRIGAAQALLGAAFKINPILAIKDGQVHPAGRVRSRSKAIDLLANFALSYAHIDEVAIEDATTPDDAQMLVERLSAKFPKERIFRSRASPVIGTHTGPGLLIVSVLGEK